MSGFEHQLDILRKLVKNPSITQRKLAKELGFSLGKLNYCMKSLRDKGLVKIQNFIFVRGYNGRRIVRLLF